MKIELKKTKLLTFILITLTTIQSVSYAMNSKTNLDYFDETRTKIDDDNKFLEIIIAGYEAVSINHCRLACVIFLGLVKSKDYKRLLRLESTFLKKLCAKCAEKSLLLSNKSNENMIQLLSIIKNKQIEKNFRKAKDQIAIGLLNFIRNDNLEGTKLFFETFHYKTLCIPNIPYALELSVKKIELMRFLLPRFKGKLNLFLFNSTMIKAILKRFLSRDDTFELFEKKFKFITDNFEVPDRLI